jgi:hypothetical protein
MYNACEITFTFLPKKSFKDGKNDLKPARNYLEGISVERHVDV